MRIPQRSKSPVLRVATAARRERAMAAIMASNCEIRRPAASRPATIGGYDRAASSSNGRIRAANASSKILSTAVAGRERRLPAGRISIP